ncbi:hypothetical protein, partial [Rhodanobacter lindaniclasticus]
MTLAQLFGFLEVVLTTERAEHQEVARRRWCAGALGEKLAGQVAVVAPDWLGRLELRAEQQVGFSGAEAVGKADPPIGTAAILVPAVAH